MSVDNNVRVLFEEVAVKDEVSIPITKTVQQTVRDHFETFAVVSNNSVNVNEPARRVDTFSNSSESSYIDIHAKRTPLTLAQSKAFILKNMWKTQYPNNKYIDETGRINCFTYPWFSTL